ncbi:hypothetical protein N431DRAFT_446409 [Stipitochalara longipes BDJ]|nr:hypothetical protein N431DRAFT_446409 [Stipitochalara longipes BDJ]
MKPILQCVGLLGFLLHPSLALRLQPRDCSANNCIRALRGQALHSYRLNYSSDDPRPPSSSHFSPSGLQCSAYVCVGLHSGHAPSEVVKTLVTTKAAVTTEIIDDYSVTSTTQTLTLHRTVTIEAGTFALYVKGGFLDGSFLVQYPDEREGSVLDLGLVMPSDQEAAYYDPDYYNFTNGNWYKYIS